MKNFRNLARLARVVGASEEHHACENCPVGAANRVVGTIDGYEIDNEFLKEMMTIVHAEFVARLASPDQIREYVARQVQAINDGFVIATDDATKEAVVEVARMKASTTVEKET